MWPDGSTGGKVFFVSNASFTPGTPLDLFGDTSIVRMDMPTVFELFGNQLVTSDFDTLRVHEVTFSATGVTLGEPTALTTGWL